MSNREALRKLSRKIPSRPEIEKIMFDLHSEPDLAAAITASAIVEATLESLIKSKFHYRDSNLIGQLFLNRGPLTDFHSKILVAHAFGVITSPLAEELHSIKSIRNAFAHSKIPLTFEHEIIGQEAQALKMGSAIRAADNEHRLGNTSNRGWFLLTVRLVLIIMNEVEDSPGLADSVIASALLEHTSPSPDKSE